MGCKAKNHHQMEDIERKVNELLILLSRHTKYIAEYNEVEICFLKDISSLLGQCNGMLYYLERGIRENQDAMSKKHMVESNKLTDQSAIEYY